jgi:hypothetical protein
MSTDMQAFLVSYVTISLIVLIGSVLVLDDHERYPYRKLTDRERVWIGRAGLAAPLWPLMAAAVLVSAIIYVLRRLIKAARGRG